MTGTRKFPIIWVIGATRSCKSALAENGIAPLGFHLIATATYFRQRYAQPDTFSRDFVFDLSRFSANCLAENFRCHADVLAKALEDANQPCVVEGERNPAEFAKLYDPSIDMAIILDRKDVDKYDTVIEKGLPIIEQIVRWHVNAGIAPQASAFRVVFGDEEIKALRFGVNNTPDSLMISGTVKEKKPQGAEIEDRYPWINILIGLVREEITNYYPATTPAKLKAEETPASNLSARKFFESKNFLALRKKLRLA